MLKMPSLKGLAFCINNQLNLLVFILQLIYLYLNRKYYIFY